MSGRLEFLSLEVKYDRFRNRDEGTWQKPLEILTTKDHFSFLSQTSCSRKKPTSGRVKMHTPTAALSTGIGTDTENKGNFILENVLSKTRNYHSLFNTFCNQTCFSECFTAKK